MEWNSCRTRCQNSASVLYKNMRFINYEFIFTCRALQCVTGGKTITSIHTTECKTGTNSSLTVRLPELAAAVIKLENIAQARRII